MLKVFYDYDVQQLGLGENAADIDGAFGSLLRTKPLNQLIFVEKFGAELEKDIGKSFIITAGGQWKSLSALGETQFRELNLYEVFDFFNKLGILELDLKIRMLKIKYLIFVRFTRL